MPPGIRHEQQIRLKGVVLVNRHIVRRDKGFADTKGPRLSSYLYVQLSGENLVRMVGAGHFNQFPLNELVAPAPVRWGRQRHIIRAGELDAGFRCRGQHRSLLGCLRVAPGGRLPILIRGAFTGAILFLGPATGPSATD